MVMDDVFLVAGSLISVSTGLALPRRQDALQSLLFSHLYANSKADRFSDADKWYKEFNNAMGRLKWNLSVYRHFRFAPSDDDVLVLRELTQQKLQGVIDSSQRDSFDRLIRDVDLSPVAEVLATAEGEHAMVKTVESGTHNLSEIVLQAGLIGPGANISSVFISFKTSQHIEREFIAQDFAGEQIVGDITVDISRHVLNEASYENSRMRSIIASKLPNASEALILDLRPGESEN